MQKYPSPPKGTYKQIFYKRCTSRPYTTAFVGYDDYLQTEVWRELKEKRLRHDNYQCQVCGTAKNIQVHHIRYPDVWGTEDIYNDLVSLCDEHHKEVHKFDKTHKEGN